MALSEKQKEYISALKSKQYRYLLFGGAVGGGKSFVVIGALHELALGYPNTRWFLVRKNLTTIKRTSVKTYEKILDINNDRKHIADFNRTELIVKYKNGSEIQFMEGDITKDPELNKLRGTEFTGGAIEEANEVDRQVLSALIHRIGRWNNKEIGGYAFIMLTCNPSQGWLKDTFYDPWADGVLEKPYYYLPALPHDNPYNTPEYLEGLKDLPEAEYKRFVEGDWNYAVDEGQLVQSEWFKQCVIDPEYKEDRKERIVLGIDPARTGKDKTVFAYFCQNKLFKFEEIASDDVYHTAGIAIDRMQQYAIAPNDVIVDVIGVGAGVVDTLRNKNKMPMAYGGGEKPKSTIDFFNFKNKRTESYWLFREALRKQEIEIVDNKELFKQLMATKYDTKDKYIQLIAKEDIKKSLSGRSPDHADAAVMAFYLMQSRPAQSIRDFDLNLKTYSSRIEY